MLGDDARVHHAGMHGRHDLDRLRLGGERGGEYPRVEVRAEKALRDERDLEAELFGIEERTATGVRGRRGKFELAEDGNRLHLLQALVQGIERRLAGGVVRCLKEGVAQLLVGGGRGEVAARILAGTLIGLEWREQRRRAVFAKYLTIYRTLADPAYLDLSIDPDDRPMGSLFAFPDPLDANYGRGGLARTMTARGWLSTWSGLSSHAKLADTMPRVKVPTILVHPTADTEIRVWQAMEIVRNAGAQDATYVEMKGAPHYFEGHRPQAMATVADWLQKRYP